MQVRVERSRRTRFCAASRTVTAAACAARLVRRSLYVLTTCWTARSRTSAKLVAARSELGLRDRIAGAARAGRRKRNAQRQQDASTRLVHAGVRAPSLLSEPHVLVDLADNGNRRVVVRALALTSLPRLSILPSAAMTSGRLLNASCIMAKESPVAPPARAVSSCQRCRRVSAAVR